MLMMLVHSFSETDKHNYAGIPDDGQYGDFIADIVIFNPFYICRFDVPFPLL